jgi:hypothetical protein
MSGFLGMLIPGVSGGLPPVTPSTYIAYGGSTTSKRITVYNWDSFTGFGSAFTTPTIPYEIHKVSFVPDNSIFSACFWEAPNFYVWRWSSLGFGTRYANPGSLVNPLTTGVSSFNWTNAVDALLTVNQSNPITPQAWRWTSSGGFGSKYSNGAAITTSSTARGTALSSDNAYFAVGMYDLAKVALYPWASGFGTRFANPSSIPVGNTGVKGVSFNPITNDLVVGTSASPFVFVYPVTSAGFGTKYAAPSVVLNTAVTSTKFSPDGASVATVNTGTPAVNAYQWGAGFGTKYANPAVLPPYGYSMDWSASTNAIATGQQTAVPYTSVYQWSASGFGAKYSNPSTVPGVAASVSFSNQSR